MDDQSRIKELEEDVDFLERRRQVSSSIIRQCGEEIKELRQALEHMTAERDKLESFVDCLKADIAVLEKAAAVRDLQRLLYPQKQKELTILRSKVNETNQGE